MKPRHKAIAIIIGSTLLAANMLIALLPTESKIGRATAAPLAPIRTATGTFQRWNMFATIPRLHALDAQIIVTTASGEEQRFSAYLPSLRDIKPVERVRYLYTLSRLFEAEDSVERQGYVDNLRRKLRKETPEAVQFSVELTFDFVRLLERITEDGDISKREVKLYGPYAIDGGPDNN